MTRFCGCKADKQGNTKGALFQDRLLGAGIRFWTGSPTGKVERCTVCGREQKK